MHKAIAAMAWVLLTVGLHVAVGADVPQVGADASVQSIANADWPQWRGPKRDDISTETGLLKEWPKGGPPLAWKATGLNDGFSGVSVAAGHIYTLGWKDDVTSLICLDMSGKKLWTTPFGTGGLGNPGMNRPGPRSTPTVDGDRVYAMDEMGTLGCFLAANGKQVWKLSIPNDLSGKVGSGWGFSESALVDGDVLVCTPGGSQGTVAGLNKMTGKTVWRSKAFTDPIAYCSLVPAEIGGVHQYVVATDAHVAGIATGGAVLWKANRDAKIVIPTPIVHDDLVFVASGYNFGCNCFQVTGSGNSFKVKQLYANKEMQVHTGAVVLVDGYVYGVSDLRRGILTCMELKTGKVVWTATSNYGNKGTVTYAEGRLYMRGEGSENGAPCFITLVEATPAGYHELGRFEQPDRSDRASWSHPVISNGKLFLRDQDLLLCYDIKAK